jgi:phosphate acetyltransferase
VFTYNDTTIIHIMDVIAEIRRKAAAAQRTIVLPEGALDDRMVQATIDVAQNKLAKLILLGDEATILAKAKTFGANPDAFRIINPEKSGKLREFVKIYMDMRAQKGKPVSEQEALESLKNPLYYGAMLVKLGEAHGSLAGAFNTTGAVITAAARIIGTKPGIKNASSFFIMVLKDKTFGQDGVLIYADCALIPNPDAETMADIAITTAHSARQLVGIDPKIAMLSFSTKGSSKDPLVDKVQQATELVKQRAPELQVDGEMQADAALIASVGAKKSPGSPVAGKANVLIFPDLNSGNISYKLTERLAGAKAIGPIMQGFAKPANDLSRGCSAEDIANMVAVTAVLSLS